MRLIEEMNLDFSPTRVEKTAGMPEMFSSFFLLPPWLWTHAMHFTGGAGGHSYDDNVVITAESALFTIVSATLKRRGRIDISHRARGLAENNARARTTRLRVKIPLFFSSLCSGLFVALF